MHGQSVMKVRHKKKHQKIFMGSIARAQSDSQMLIVLAPRKACVKVVTTSVRWSMWTVVLMIRTPI